MKSLLPLFGIVGAFLVIGAVAISSGILPEEQAKDFRPLLDLSMPSGMIVLQEPTLDDNVFAYAVNEIAARGIDIAKQDPEVQQLLEDARQREAFVTMAAVQPTVLADRESGNLMYSPTGQVIITSNWQTIDGRRYSQPQSFEDVWGKSIESRQQIWHVTVNVDSRVVTSITQQADRVGSYIPSSNTVLTEVNMFMPNNIAIDTGSTIAWLNRSNLPHNVVGIFNHSSTGPTGLIPEEPAGQEERIEELPSGAAIDSGFIEANRSWKYSFDEPGVFNYICTIHAEEGMRGTLVISSP